MRLAARIGDAEVEGDEEGSSRLTFAPRGLHPGDYDVDVGTAGSATLVLQTVLPPLLTADGPSTLRVTGGTHNPSAPPFDFLERVYLPVMRRLGPQVEAELLRPGFMPAGGGRIAVTVRPAARLARLDLRERGEIQTRRAEALLANLPRHVAERELAVVGRSGWAGRTTELHVRELKGVAGMGNALLLEVGVRARHRARVRARPAGPARGDGRAAGGGGGLPRGWTPTCPSASTWPISSCCPSRSVRAACSGRCRCPRTRRRRST